MNISNPGQHNTAQASEGNAHVTWANKLLRKAPPAARGHIVAAIGEFAGTIFFLFFAFAGTQVANISSNPNTGTTIVTTVAQKNPAQLLYISLSFGFSLAVNAWVFFRISGGLFNPAVCTPPNLKHIFNSSGNIWDVDYWIYNLVPRCTSYNRSNSRSDCSSRSC